ncbi:MAG: histidine phosphatase family protein [Acidimicrobiia bacterium]|nr:histidine phosphatase family protein [Acidimicrobiia bacterium]
MVELTREIWLLRHGATDFSESGRYCGQLDIPLTARGRLQVLPRRADVSRISHDWLWSSDLQRCVETARIVAGDPTVDKRLREFDFGRIEGLRFDELDHATQEGILAFDGFAAPGGETVPEFRARIESFFDELPAGRHLIVTHGGVIRLLLRRMGHDFRVRPGGLVFLSRW